MLAVTRLTASDVFAQKFEIGLNAGGGFSTVQFKSVDDSYIEYHTSVIPYLNLGIATKCRPNNKCSIITELQFVRKGFHIQSRSDVGGRDIVFLTTESTHALYYLEIPVTFFLDANKMFFGAGIYGDFALLGRTNSTEEYYDALSMEVTDKTESRNQKILFKNERMNSFWARRFDYGLKGEIGYLIRPRYRLSAIYEHGLLNVIPQYDYNKSSAYYRSLTLKLAYFFKHK